MTTITSSVARLSAPIGGEDYMRVLLERQATYMTEHPSKWPPLLEWFVQPGDENWVRLPDQQPTSKRETKPRVYRSAASIREALARVDAQMERITGRDCGDNAVVNLSPLSRSRAARTAGRRRFAQLDRDLERYTRLSARRKRLASSLAAAEAREATVSR